MPRLPVLIRQSKVFDLVVQGKDYAEICAALRISEDTVARDMQAIGDQVRELSRARLGEVVAVALATYQRVIDEAWREYRADAQRERDWFAGKFDYTTEGVATKTLALDEAGEEGEGQPRKGNTSVQVAAQLFPQESEPIEVKRTVRIVRPALRGEGRSKWLTLIVDTTREMTELLGVKKLIIEHQGAGGGPLFKVYQGIDVDAV
jgi:ribosomal protein L25 (general stress protein Ctc)